MAARSSVRAASRQMKRALGVRGREAMAWRCWALALVTNGVDMGASGLGFGTFTVRLPCDSPASYGCWPSNSFPSRVSTCVPILSGMAA